MKKQVFDFVKSLGGITSYSGNTKTMWIKGENKGFIEQKVIEKFGFGLSFKISA